MRVGFGANVAVALRQVRRLSYTAGYRIARALHAQRDGLRHVQGVDLWVPAGHTLPLFAKVFPEYGQNLVHVAAFLEMDCERSLVVIDVGSNIGDSAVQLAAAVHCSVLCIEGDPVWLPFLYRNVKSSGFVVDPVFLDVGAAQGAAVVRSGGTSKLVPTTGKASPGTEFSTISEILTRNPGFSSPDLVKSDTDGYDCLIVAEIARSEMGIDAVLFFEYDPWMTNTTGNPPAETVWSALSETQYEHVVVWDNFGNLVAHGRIEEVERLATCFRQSRKRRGYDYWDVAVLKSDQQGRYMRLLEYLSQRGKL